MKSDHFFYIQFITRSDRGADIWQWDSIKEFLTCFKKGEIPELDTTLIKVKINEAEIPNAYTLNGRRFGDGVAELLLYFRKDEAQKVFGEDINELLEEVYEDLWSKGYLSSEDKSLRVSKLELIQPLDKLHSELDELKGRTDKLREEIWNAKDIDELHNLVKQTDLEEGLEIISLFG